MVHHWHERHERESDFGDHIADATVGAMGSWTFLIAQTVFVAFWMTANVVHFTANYAWDRYPFILLNLAFSTQAAYAAPLILMASKRAAKRDKLQADAQYEDTKATHEIVAKLDELLRRNTDVTDATHDVAREIHRKVVQ